MGMMNREFTPEMDKRMHELLERNTEGALSSEERAELLQLVEPIQLSLADQERFAAALIDPPPISPALKRAAELHRELIQPSSLPDKERDE